MKTLKTIAAAGLLLGATSVMAQTNVGSGQFTFTIVPDITVDCDDAVEITKKAEMVVSAPANLKYAKATVLCNVKTTATDWTLSLTTANNGILQDASNSDTPIELDGVPTVGGEFGVWVEFTGDAGSANISTEKTPVSLVSGGTSNEVGTYITNLSGSVELSDAFDNGSASFVSTGEVDATLEIRAALIGTAVTSGAGSFTETVIITASTDI